jgi:hypothetical protein
MPVGARLYQAETALYYKTHPAKVVRKLEGSPDASRLVIQHAHSGNNVFNRQTVAQGHVRQLTRR